MREHTTIAALTTRPVAHIPGPNPLVVRGGPGEWDEAMIECGDIFRDYSNGAEIYYLYYHGAPADAARWPRAGYRIGVATARHPLGPFTKSPHNPILDLGPEGAWDDRHVACPSIIKDGTDRYFMWYSAKGGAVKSGYSVGLATACHPLGPWRKHEGNPVLPRFGYVGGVVKVGGKYRMYNEFPVGEIGDDYGPLALATAEHPEGPWEPWAGSPVLPLEDWGTWDDGGYSEAKVAHSGGVYHCFYGGAKLHPTRIRTLESIGYACSGDGVHWVKHVDNPLAPRERLPGASAFGEVKCLIEPPFAYLYHTLRYLSAESGVEDLGVQVLAMTRPFRLSIPVLSAPALAAGAHTPPEACATIVLDAVTSLVVGVSCRFDELAGAGARVHVIASADGQRYDTVDWCAFDTPFAASRVESRTAAVPTGPRYVRVSIENLDRRVALTDLEVMATVAG